MQYPTSPVDACASSHMKGNHPSSSHCGLFASGLETAARGATAGLAKLPTDMLLSVHGCFGHGGPRSSKKTRPPAGDW